MMQSLSLEESQLIINDVQIRKARLILKAIDHKLRQQIMQYINSQGQASVTVIYTALDLEQSVASQHLAILRKAGCVSTLRLGKQIHYSVNHERIDEVHGIVKNFLNS